MGRPLPALRVSLLPQEETTSWETRTVRPLPCAGRAGIEGNRKTGRRLAWGADFLPILGSGQGGGHFREKVNE